MYIEEYVDVQYEYGVDINSTVVQNNARDHFFKYGFKQNRSVEAREGEGATLCGDNEDSSCECDGTIWMGAKYRPDNGKKIETLDQMRKFMTADTKSHIGENYVVKCEPSYFHYFDPHPGKEKQCFCERKPKYVPRRCALDGGECICAGHILFGRQYEKGSTSKNATFQQMKLSPFTATESNETHNANDMHHQGKVYCNKTSFEDVDPLPGEAKACYCDTKPLFDDKYMEKIKRYWRSKSQQRSA